MILAKESVQVKRQTSGNQTFAAYRHCPNYCLHEETQMIRLETWLEKYVLLASNGRIPEFTDSHATVALLQNRKPSASFDDLSTRQPV